MSKRYQSIFMVFVVIACTASSLALQGQLRKRRRQYQFRRIRHDGNWKGKPSPLNIKAASVSSWMVERRF